MTAGFRVSRELLARSRRMRAHARRKPPLRRTVDSILGTPIVASSVSAPALVPSAGCAVRVLVSVSVRVQVPHLEKVRWNGIGEKERLAVVEVDPFLPSVERVHRDHDVVARTPPPGLERVVWSERKMQEATSPRAQSVAPRALGVRARDAHEQQGRRPRRLARLHLDRVSVESAYPLVQDFVANAVSGRDRGSDVLLLDGLPQAFVQGLDDIVEFGVAELVELEIELLRLMAQHVSEGAGDAFDQSGMGHDSEGRWLVGSNVGPRGEFSEA
jgi:hypothetical protein